MELFLASVKINISTTDSISFVPEISFYYQKPLIDPIFTFNCHYSCIKSINKSGWDVVFSGESFEKAIIPYKWQILKKLEETKILITFFDHPTLSEAAAILSLHTMTIDVQLVSKTADIITIDPLFHPLGSLLMVYLAYYSGGMLIHASGIKDINNGYLFTGVSGIGKSTMSRLWKEKGAIVINDDRLWLHKINEKWYMFNTPMMQYAQKPLMAPLIKAFLLKQSAQNESVLIKGTQGSLRLMANCIQHFYNKEMTTVHLERIIDMTSSVPVFDLGFKPDTVIVDMIRLLKP